MAAPVNWVCGLSRPIKIENGDRADFEALRAELEPLVRTGFDFEGGGPDGDPGGDPDGGPDGDPDSDPDGSPKRPRLTDGATSCAY